jgi:hypothetical protein
MSFIDASFGFAMGLLFVQVLELWKASGKANP